MSYQVKQGNIFGRIGEGIGRGVSEAAPKEIERGRLAAGLQQFEQESAKLSPMQQLARLSAIPGITPQMVQSFSELAKTEGERQGYKRAGAGERLPPVPSTANFALKAGEIPFAGVKNRPNQAEIDQNQPTMRGQPLGEEQVVPVGPTSEQLQNRAPWTPDQRDIEKSRVWDLPQNRNKTSPEIDKIVADNEQRYLNMPVAAQKEYDRRQDELDDAKKRFRENLKTKLQKTDVEGVYKDITGENLIALEREMDRYLATHPNTSKDDAADMFSAKALNLAKTKDQLRGLASEKGLTRFTKQGQTLDKLKSYQKAYKDSGNSEEYFNTLKSDFDLSPQAAASIAFPLSKPVQEYVSKIRNSTPANAPTNARKYAIELADKINRDDSILAVARAIKDKDPFFDQRGFFNQIREDRNRYSDIQNRDVDEGESDYFPNWGDIFTLPLTRW